MALPHRTAAPSPSRGATGEAPSDRAAISLYAVRRKIYPREVWGRFSTIRAGTVGVLVAVWVGLPWLSWDGRQAVLFDIPARKFYVFGIVLWPQDFFYLALLLIAAAVALFLFTAVAGRLWCGYACPQTVWTEISLWIDRLVEGKFRDRRKIDEAPWTLSKIGRKLAKHALWLGVSFAAGFAFVGYFTPISKLAGELFTGSLGTAPLVSLALATAGVYAGAGWMREQLCIYLCPYARFQGAMFDRDTLIISYDSARGEPRGPRSRRVDARALGLGDCVDCSLCVQVCPTGIDIRAGLQYECIGCASCIDVCDQVMDGLGTPRGLVRYATESSLEGKPSRLLRPRVIAYAALLVVVLGAGAASIRSRVPVALDVLRDRNTLYREIAGGWIENSYTVKILNMDERPHRYLLTVAGQEGARLGLDETSLVVPAGAVRNVPARVQLDPVRLDAQSVQLDFSIEAADDPRIRKRERARFVGPSVE